MNENSRQGPAQGGSRLSILVWVGLAGVGLIALVGVIFNLLRILRPSSTPQPSLVPRAISREVQINSTLSLAAESGTFKVWGDPVNRGVICDRGEIFDLEYQDRSPDPDLLTDLWVRKQFVCRDGSGSFEMTVDADLEETSTSGTWEIVSGEGDYRSLTGSGTFAGTYLNEDLVVDSFTGTVSQ